MTLLHNYSRTVT